MLSALKKIEKKDLLKHSIIVLDSNLQIVSVNGLFKGQTGDFLDLVTKGFKKTFQASLSKLSSKKQSIVFDTKLDLKDQPATDFRIFCSLIDGNYHITAVEIQTVLKMQEEAENFQKWALLDPLTNILNRRGYWVLTDNMIHRAARDHKGLGILFFDMDRLKKINTEQGHEGGDTAIREIADIMKSITRKTDVVARTGGDEFVIVFDLDPTKDFTIEDMCERLMTKTNKGKSSLSTVSVGAHYVKPGEVEEISKSEDPLQLWEKHIEIADEYSHEAKKRGKNQYITDALYAKYQNEGFFKRNASRLLAGIRS